MPPYGAAWGAFAHRMLTRWGNFSWISPAPLFASINDKVVKGSTISSTRSAPRWIASTRPVFWTGLQAETWAGSSPDRFAALSAW